MDTVLELYQGDCLQIKDIEEDFVHIILHNQRLPGAMAKLNRSDLKKVIAELIGILIRMRSKKGNRNGIF